MPDPKTTIEIEGKDSGAAKALDAIKSKIQEVDEQAQKSAGNIARSARIIDTSAPIPRSASLPPVRSPEELRRFQEKYTPKAGGSRMLSPQEQADLRGKMFSLDEEPIKAKGDASKKVTDEAKKQTQEYDKQEGYLKRIRVSLNAMAARFAGASPLSPVISTAQSALGVGGGMGIGIAGGAIAAAALVGIAQQIKAADVAHEHVMHNIDIERRAMAGANEQARLAHVNKLANAIEEKRIEKGNYLIIPNNILGSVQAEGQKVAMQNEQIKNATEAIRLGKESIEIARLESVGADYAADKLRRKMEVTRQIAEIQNNAGLNADQKKELTAQARELDRLQHIIPPQFGVGDSLTQAGGGGGVFLPSGSDSALPADPAMDRNNELLNNIEAAINDMTEQIRGRGFNTPTIRINRN